MKNYDPLWKLLRATTNSPNDVWKPRHYKRHKGIPSSLLGQPVIRYSVPILKLGTTSKGINIYLIIQFSTDILDYRYFVIDKKVFTKDLKTSTEYVYAFNTRICLETEFKTKHHGQIISNGEIKEPYREEILQNAFGLMRGTPRQRIVNEMLNTDKYKKWNANAIDSLIKLNQFSNEEREYKGVAKKDKK